MKKLVFAMAAVAAGAVMADDAKAVEGVEKNDAPITPSIEVGVDVLSDYMWRGIILNDNWVWQPSVTLGVGHEDFGEISFNYWASFDLTHRRNKIPGGGNGRSCMSIQEQDFYLGYKKSLGDFEFEIGHFWYDYPNNGKRIAGDGWTGHYAGTLGSDLYFSVAYNNPIAKLQSEFYWSYSDAHDRDPSGLYVRLSASHDFKFFDDKLTLTPKTELGIGDHQFTKNNIAGYREDSRDNYGVEMTDHTTQLALSYAVTDYFSIGAKVCYTWVPSASLRNERWLTGGHDSRNGIVWGGVSAAFSF